MSRNEPGPASEAPGKPVRTSSSSSGVRSSRDITLAGTSELDDNDNPFSDSNSVSSVCTQASSNVRKVSRQTNAPPEPSWSLWRRLKESQYNPSLMLVNSGSVARDHLANERTVLAYVRTSLALASMGVALVQFLSLADSSIVQKVARPIGAVGIILGLFTLADGVIRYFVVQRTLVQGQFPVARAGLCIVGLSLGVLVCIIFGILVAARS